MLCGNTIIIRDEATNDNRSSSSKIESLKRRFLFPGWGGLGGGTFKY